MRKTYSFVTHVTRCGLLLFIQLSALYIHTIYKLIILIVTKQTIIDLLTAEIVSILYTVPKKYYHVFVLIVKLFSQNKLTMLEMQKCAKN